MESISKVLGKALNESFQSDEELRDIVLKLKRNVNAENFYNVAFPNKEINPSLQRVMDVYDPYVEEIIEIIYNPASRIYEICDNIKEAAENNEWDNGTESDMVVNFLYDLYDWCEQNGLVNEEGINESQLFEGAGAGYTVSIEGLAIDEIDINSIRRSKDSNGEPIFKFKATLSDSLVTWKAEDYYGGVSSEGIYYNGDIIEEFDDSQRTINGGIVEGHIYMSDVKDYLGENSVVKDDVIDYIQYNLDDEFSIETMFGRGWVHIDLDDPIEFHDIEIKDQYGVANVFIDTIIINAPEITKTINWFFKNKEEIYKEFEDEDLDESVKIKTKKKSITEDLSKADKEDAESKMDKWHEGKRKQNVKARSTDKLIMNLGICKRKGYDSEAEQIQDELDSRGINESQLFESEDVVHTFEPEFDEVIEHVKNGTVDAEKDSEILFDALVPGSGHADSLGGELLRAAERIAYRYFNDGDMAGEGYGRETVNPAVRFMKENVTAPSPLYGIVRDFYRFIDYGCSVTDKEYEFMVMRLLKLTVIYIVENKLWDVPNQEDMHNYKDPDVDVDRRDDWEDEEY